MKIAIISDIHGNLTAFKAVLRDFRLFKPESIYCLGDVVGYGPHPRECLNIVRNISKVILGGNHERAVVNEEFNQEFMNKVAAKGVLYSRGALPQEDLNYIAALSPIYIEDKMAFAHGAFSDPWEYIDSEDKAEEELKTTPARICFVGHTHIPFVFSDKQGLIERLPDNMVLNPEEKFLINVGSVGQPRDGDCRARYCQIEICGKKVSLNLREVFYNIKRTEEAMKKTNLPMVLAERLYCGE